MKKFIAYALALLLGIGGVAYSQSVPSSGGGSALVPSTLTDGGVLLGSGTDPITALGVLADSEMIVGNGTTDPVIESGATLRTSIGVAIGTDVQAFDAQLTDVAGLAVTDGLLIVGDGANFVTESGATLRTSIGVDAAGTDNSTDVTLAGTPDYITISGQVITRGKINMVTDIESLVPIGSGGTNATGASAARTNLGVAIGSDVQAFAISLDDLGALGAPASDGQFIVATGAGVFAYETPSVALTSIGGIGAATADTLTNKTYALGGTGNAFTGTAAEFDTAVTDDNFAYLGAAQTFTAVNTFTAADIGAIHLSGNNVGIKFGDGTGDGSIHAAASSFLDFRMAATSTRFQDSAGGTAYTFRSSPTTSKFTIEQNGDPTSITFGMIVNLSAADDDAYVLEDSTDMAHGMTTITPTSTILRIREFDGAGGGALLGGFSDDASDPTAFAINASALDTSVNDTTSTSGIGLIMLSAYVDDDGTSRESLAAAGITGNLLAVRDGTSTQMLVKEDGDLWLNGGLTTNGNSVLTGTASITGILTMGANLVSDTDSTDDLGTTGVRWANLFVDAITVTDDVTITGQTLTTAIPTATVDGATTFAVTTNHVILACTGTETIDTITGGVLGQYLHIEHSDTECTLNDDPDATAADAFSMTASLAGAVNTSVVLFYNGTYWLEVSRSVNG